MHCYGPQLERIRCSLHIQVERERETCVHFHCCYCFRWLAEQTVNPAKNLIMNGTEIYRMSACGVTLKDSRLFLPMALSKLPEAFGLKELAKGYFPYTFDTPDHDDYVGTWPAAPHYLPDQMMPKDRKKFFTWYESVKHKVKRVAT